MMNAYTYNFPRPMVTVDAVVFAGAPKDVNVVLIERKHDPFQGKWALPGGFVDIDEPLDAAVARELKEETGLGNIDLKQLHTFGDPGRDPRGRSITVVYYGFIPKILPLSPGDDAAKAAWFSIDQLPPLAFDHRDIIAYALAKMGTSCK